MEKNSTFFETCVICGKETDVPVTTHVDFRHNYVEGCGQCCSECYNKTYDDSIRISPQEILNTPNDMELGSKVRERYWSLNK